MMHRPDHGPMDLAWTCTIVPRIPHGQTHGKSEIYRGFLAFLVQVAF